MGKLLKKILEQMPKRQNRIMAGEYKMQKHQKWTGIRLEIAKYITENHITEKDFRFLGIYEWQNIYDKVLEHFVDEQYARKCGLHWSNIENGFQKNIDILYAFTYINKDSYKWMERLHEIVKCEKVYLILDEDESTKYWIAECSPAIVDLIINDAISSVDYYITDKKFNWLITENHSEVVKFIGKDLDIEVIKNVCAEYAEELIKYVR